MNTLINVVLDKSGSMGMVWDATISGFNEFLEEQKQAAPDARFSLTLFDTRFNPKHSNIPVAKVPALSRKSYVPAGNTALYDAVGHAIKDVEALGENVDRVVFVILTDGQENSSVEYDQKQIFDLIKWHQDENKGWEFVFLGANQDSYASGAAIGIRAANTMNYNSTVLGTQSAFRGMSNVTSSYASGKTDSAAIPDSVRTKVESTK